MLALPALAADAATGVDGLNLTRQIYCDVKLLVGGNIGLLVGFAAALFGLLQMIQGNTGSGILIIAAGALVTQLPALIEGSLDGVAGVLKGAGITGTDNRGFYGPGCDGAGGSPQGKNNFDINNQGSF